MISYRKQCYRYNYTIITAGRQSYVEYYTKRTHYILPWHSVGCRKKKAYFYIVPTLSLFLSSPDFMILKLITTLWEMWYLMLLSVINFILSFTSFSSLLTLERISVVHLQGYCVIFFLRYCLIHSLIQTLRRLVNSLYCFLGNFLFHSSMQYLIRWVICSFVHSFPL